MYGSISSLMIFLALFGSNNGQISCNYDTFIQPGRSYELKNYEYPNTYVAGSSCRWVFKSRWDQRVKIQCQDMNIPSDQHCQGDRLEIQDGVGPVANFCSIRQFPYTSKSSRLTVTLRTFQNRLLGRFNCRVEAVQPNVCDCGRRNAPKIYGGKEIGVNEYPFMAAIVDTNTHGIICGGTIINKKQVLTAAHCVKNRREKTFGVLVGAHNLNKVQDTPSAKFFLAQAPIVHWSYIGPNSGSDIAIVTITGEFEFNEAISPVCLPFQRPMDSFANQYTDILGWGANSLVSGPLNVLMKARVAVTTETTCSFEYPGTSNKHICTQEAHKDSCTFDSGGPLTIQTETSRKVIQIGVMNKGPACGQGKAALNIRVGPFIDWIVRNTPEDIRDQYCQSE